MQDTCPQSSSASEPLATNAFPALPLPHPFPDYVTCPHCGEPEIEIWCYQAAVQCNNCGGWIRNKSEIRCRDMAVCQPKQAGEHRCRCG